MMHQVMFQCGDFLISGIVAAEAGAGVESIPADSRAGGGLRVVTHQSMVQCGQFFAGGIVAAGTGVVSIPADSRTGGGLRIVVHKVMTELVNPVSLRIGTVSA